MSSSMNELLSLLAEKEQAMEEMTVALSEEQQSLLAMNTESLEMVLRRKSELTTKLFTLCEQCRLLMMRIGAERGVELGESPRLSQLFDVAEESEQEQFRPRQQMLVNLAGIVERQSVLNRKILANANLIVDRSMALFRRLLGGTDTYGGHGRVTPATSAISFVSKEI